MGTHPSGPSLLVDNGYAGQPLLALLRDRPQMLGAALPRFGCDLPFLFKVLSVGTALSIQSHPDKELAERLHAEKPEVGAGRTAGRGRQWGGVAGPVPEQPSKGVRGLHHHAPWCCFSQGGFTNKQCLRSW